MKSKHAFIDPAIVLSMFMLSFILLIVSGLFERKRICAGFVLLVYIYTAVGNTVIKRGW
jgi:hypothetical protein